MNFTKFFYKKIIKYKKYKQNKVLYIIIFFSKISILFGIIIIYLTFSIGLGSRYAIKKKLSNFSGHILITKLNNYNFYESVPIPIKDLFYSIIPCSVPISNLNEFALKSGIIYNKKYIEGIVFKGVSYNYNWNYFKDFIVKGVVPNLRKNSLNNEVLLSKSLAFKLGLDIGDYFTIYFFFNPLKNSIVNSFVISGLYNTGIKNFDQIIIIGDINQIKYINKWKKNQTGGFEIFIKNINKIEFLEKEINTHINNNLKAQSVLTRFESIKEWINLFDINILIITIIMIIVVTINIVVFLFILIIEKSYNIGMLKILGTSNSDIRKIFIYYSFFLLRPSILLGNLISLSLLFLQKKFNFIHLNPENYYINFIPIYFHPMLIIWINFITILLILLILWIIPTIIIKKILPTKSIKFY